MSAIRFSGKKEYDQVQLFFDRQKRKPIKVLKLYHVIFVVAQRGFSAQVAIKIGIRRDEKNRFTRTNSSSENPPQIKQDKVSPVNDNDVRFNEN